MTDKHTAAVYHRTRHDRRPSAPLYTYNRREFLRLLGGSAVAASCLTNNLEAFAASSNRRLILVELAGANDGLNTLVPFKDERYRALRPKLGLGESEILRLTQEVGLHAAMERLLPGWEAGELAIVQGLGYPAPNRSHFKSIQLWETGGDGQRRAKHGWLTHDLEHRFPITEVDAHGISFDGRMGVFSSPGGNWLSMSTATQFNDTDKLQTVPVSADNPSLDAVLASHQTLRRSIESISSRMENSHLSARIRQSELAQQLSHVVNMINAGVKTPVYKVSLGGFDTHENQRNRHYRLLRSLAQSLGGLRRELKRSGEWNNTLVMTYSEFGRRAAENLSDGTDHGTASVHFVLGGRVQGGLYGVPPDLGNLIDNDLVHTLDYRALYQQVLADWMQIPANRFASFAQPSLKSLIG